MQYPSNANNVYLGWRNIIRYQHIDKSNFILAYDTDMQHLTNNSVIKFSFSLQVRDSLRLATAEATEYQQSIARRVSHIAFPNLSI